MTHLISVRKASETKKAGAERLRAPPSHRGAEQVSGWTGRCPSRDPENYKAGSKGETHSVGSQQPRDQATCVLASAQVGWIVPCQGGASSTVWGDPQHLWLGRYTAFPSGEKQTCLQTLANVPWGREA